MNPRLLSVQQLDALSALVNMNRLRIVPSDFNKAERFLNQSGEILAEIHKVDGAKLKHGIAYDAAHDVGEAMMAAYGYATTNGSGQHQTIGETLAILLAGTTGENEAEVFDQVREDRNHIRYRSSSIGKAQAESAVQCAKTLLTIAQEILES